MSNINKGIRELTTDEIASVSGGSLGAAGLHSFLTKIDKVLDGIHNPIATFLDKIVERLLARGL
jgi:hypothetical protein